VNAAIQKVYLCFCASCQSHFGGTHSSFVRVAKSAVVIDGETTGLNHFTESQCEAVKAFCGHCGVVLWFENGAHWDIATSNLASISEKNISTQIQYASQRARWYPGAFLDGTNRAFRSVSSSSRPPSCCRAATYHPRPAG
jgi:hypothetical protein